MLNCYTLFTFLTLLTYTLDGVNAMPSGLHANLGHTFLVLFIVYSS